MLVAYRMSVFYHSTCRSLWLLASLLLCALCHVSIAHAGDGTISSASEKRVGDQIWIVSTRHLDCSAARIDALPNYSVQYFAQCDWHESDARQLLDNVGFAGTTVFYVHGNRYEQHDAIYSGWQVYQALARQRAAGQPLRLVIWSWPSEKAAQRPIRDAREKASRTAAEGYFLARFWQEWPSDVPTGIIGYSFGARVTLGGLHLLSGGQLEGYALQSQPTMSHQLRVALLAGGAEYDGLLPGGMFGHALNSSERLLNLYNPCDPALKHYRVIDKFVRPEAIGCVGVGGENSLTNGGANITQRNVSGIIGRSHDEERYFHSDSIMRDVREFFLETH